MKKLSLIVFMVFLFTGLFSQTKLRLSQIENITNTGIKSEGVTANKVLTYTNSTSSAWVFPSWNDLLNKPFIPVSIYDLTNIDATGWAEGKLFKLNATGVLVIGNDNTGITYPDLGATAPITYNPTTGVFGFSGTIPTNNNQLTNGAGYITGFTELDPTYTGSSWYSTTNNATNWNTAYSDRGKVLVNGETTMGPLSSTNFSISGGIVYPITSNLIENNSYMPVTSNAAYDALVLKQDVITIGANTQYLRGDLSLATIPVNHLTPDNIIQGTNMTITKDGNNVTFNATGGSTITGSATTIDTESLTASRAVISNASQKIDVSATTSTELAVLSGIPSTLSATELGYSDGVTSGIQSQLAARALINGDYLQAFKADRFKLASDAGWSIFGNGDRVQFEYNSAIKMNLYASGAIEATSASFTGTVSLQNAVLNGSDRRLKQNIQPIDFDNMGAVKWVQFEMTSDSTHAKRYGVIAQELEKILPELVYTDSKGMKAVAYTDLLVLKMAYMERQMNFLKSICAILAVTVFVIFLILMFIRNEK